REEWRTAFDNYKKSARLKNRRSSRNNLDSGELPRRSSAATRTDQRSQESEHSPTLQTQQKQKSAYPYSSQSPSFQELACRNLPVQPVVLHYIQHLRIWKAILGCYFQDPPRS